VAAGSISDYRADPDQAAYPRVLSPASAAGIGMDESAQFPGAWVKGCFHDPT
jgi:hypothetical protein